MAPKELTEIERSIRPAEKKDIPYIKAIASATELFPAEMLDEMIAGYLDGSKRDFWFVSGDVRGDDGPLDSVVSFGFCEPERMTEGTWNLLAIGVNPDHQGRGIGAAMMAYLEKRLTEIELARILLVETIGIPEYDRTRAFYKKNGFIEEARIREFYEAGADKIVYWKHL
jgi:ribosomal protein S18 acetylase RimI-like enzyme